MIGTEMEVNSVGRYGDAPSVLVASDNISGGRIIESALAAIDARIVDSLPLAGLEDRLDRMVSISAVIVHADIGTPAPQLERIGARLNMMATEGARSEESRVGKECVSTCRSRWSPAHVKNK